MNISKAHGACSSKFRSHCRKRELELLNADYDWTMDLSDTDFVLILEAILISGDRVSEV